MKAKSVLIAWAVSLGGLGFINPASAQSACPYDIRQVSSYLSTYVNNAYGTISGLRHLSVVYDLRQAILNVNYYVVQDPRCRSIAARAGLTEAYLGQLYQGLDALEAQINQDWERIRNIQIPSQPNIR